MVPKPRKPVTLLKRSPAAPSSPSSPAAAARAADAVRAVVGGALTRERERLHALYTARQEALLTVLVDVLRDDLRVAVAEAAAAEAAALADAVRAMGGGKGQSQNGGGGGGPKVSAATVAFQEPAAVRAAFKSAFEGELLGAIEMSLATALATVSKAVDAEAEARVAAPAADSAALALRRAADRVRADAAAFDSVVSAATARGGAGDGSDGAMEMATPVGREDAALAAVAHALAERRVRDALELSLGESAVVRAKAVSGALDAGVPAEEVFAPRAGASVPAAALAGLIALLAADLTDRTATRLEFLMEATMALEDAPRSGGDGGDDVSADRGTEVRLLNGAIAKLKDMRVADGGAGPAEVKQAKMLVRCLKVTVQAIANS